MEVAGGKVGTEAYAYALYIRGPKQDFQFVDSASKLIIYVIQKVGRSEARLPNLSIQRRNLSRVQKAFKRRSQ